MLDLNKAFDAAARELFSAHGDPEDWDDPEYAELVAWAQDDAKDAVTAALPEIIKALADEVQKLCDDAEVRMDRYAQDDFGSAAFYLWNRAQELRNGRS